MSWNSKLYFHLSVTRWSCYRMAKIKSAESPKCNSSATSKAKWWNFELLAELLVWYPKYDHWDQLGIHTSLSPVTWWTQVCDPELASRVPAHWRWALHPHPCQTTWTPPCSPQLAPWTDSKNPISQATNKLEISKDDITRSMLTIRSCCSFTIPFFPLILRTLTVLVPGLDACPPDPRFFNELFNDDWRYLKDYLKSILLWLFVVLSLNIHQEV